MKLETKSDKIKFVKFAIEEMKGASLEKDIDESTELYSLKLDSLDVVELQLFYEEKTGKIAKDPAEPVLTVGQLINLME